MQFTLFRDYFIKAFPLGRKIVQGSHCRRFWHKTLSPTIELLYHYLFFFYFFFFYTYLEVLIVKVGIEQLKVLKQLKNMLRATGSSSLIRLVLDFNLVQSTAMCYFITVVFLFRGTAPSEFWPIRGHELLCTSAYLIDGIVKSIGAAPRFVYSQFLSISF